jgi:glyoxylate reductase
LALIYIFQWVNFGYIIKEEYIGGGDELSKPFVYITRMLPEEVLTPLKEIAEVEMWPHEETPVPADILKNKATKAVGLITMLSDQIDQEIFENSPNLKVVANLAVGFNNIDIKAASKKGVYVCNTPDVLTETTADLTFALLMATARRIVEAAEYVKAGKWLDWSPFLLAGHDIFGKTIGIVGMGRIGQAVAKRALGFNMNVLYHNRSQNLEAESELGVTYLDFESLLEQSDYVVCLTPLTNETVNLFNEDAFIKMKNQGIFINVSRGAVVDENALYNALENKEIAAAGLDVFEKEPILPNHPLLQLENVVALPHIGSSSFETRWKMCELVVENISRTLHGNKPKTIVNT